MPENNSLSCGLRLEDFEYELPEELIAQEPPAVRDASRLMSVNREHNLVADHLFVELPELLASGDLLVVNDTKVIPARLQARRASGALVEILLLRPEPSRPGVWQAMAMPLRKLRQDELLYLGTQAEDTLRVDKIYTADDGQRRLLLDCGSQENIYRILTGYGLAPLPPYIRRAAANERQDDLCRYQTVFARAPGAVAAPTAGLHFTQEIFARLKAKEVEVQKITLHVGPGTFKPITAGVDEHSIEAERYSITAPTAIAINQALAAGRRIIAVGTTSCRALETAGLTGKLAPANDASTRLYIKPGYQFKVVSGLITNFHLSRSSLLVLVSAFAGHDLIMQAYQRAIADRYRFFSYGDAMLII